MSERKRYILNCDIGSIGLAARAAEYGEHKMPHKDAIIVYGDAPEVRFYVKRTKGGISVQQFGADE